MHHIPARPRPPFARWLFERDLDFRQAAARLGCSHETVRLICLPFDDPKRRVPNVALMDKIIALTDGEVAASDFFQKTAAEALDGAAGDDEIAA